MVNPKIKQAIENGEFSWYMMIKQIKTLTEPKRKGIDFWRKDTAKYVLKNFGDIISQMDPSEFRTVLEECGKDSKIAELVFGAAQNSLESIIELLNRSYPGVSYSIIENLKAAEYSDKLLTGNVAELYGKIDRDKVDLSALFFKNNGGFFYGEEIREEYMAVLANAVRTGSIHPSDVTGYIEEIKKDEQGVAFLSEYAATLVSVTNSPLKTLEQLGNAGVDTKGLNEIVDSRINDIAKEMLGQNSPVKISDTIEDGQSNVREMLVLMIQDLVKNEQVAPSEIRHLSKGGFANVFEVGDKVLKIGRPPLAYGIPKNSKRFLQPIVRTVQNSCNALGIKQPVNIEILEKCDVSTPPAEEELYMIYKELREEGMIWTDAKKSNVGRLLKSNRVHFKGIEKVHHDNVGFDEDKQVEELGPGELVILDLDFIFKEGSSRIQWPRGGTLSRQFEKRYQGELEEKLRVNGNVIQKKEVVER
ncbi:MAG: hypothetical protein IKK43_03660 [Clostridia bacterium]|nr:hypothetical protein [Clostridia bacterium]